MYAHLIGRGTGAPPSGSTNYFAPEGILTGEPTEAQAACPVPHALTIDRLRFRVAVAPTSTKTWTLTLMKNGSATALTCTITGTATSNSDTTNSVTFAAGDTISLRLTPSGTPATMTGGFAVSMRQSASGMFALFTSRQATMSATTFIAAVSDNNNATEAQAQAEMPGSFTFQNLYARVNTAPGTGTSWAFTLRKNTAATALTCTIADTATSNSDLTHTVAFAAADRIAIQAAVTGAVAATTVTFGMSVVPANDGEAFWLNSHSNQASGTATNFTGIHVGGASYGTTDSFAAGTHFIGQLGTIKALYARLSAAAGAGKSFTMTVNINAVNTALTFAVSGASAQTGNLTGQTIAVADDDGLSIQITPAGTPGNTRVQMGVLYAADPGTAPQKMRARLVDSRGSWVTDTGATSGLPAAINEAVASDANYVKSSLHPSLDTLSVWLDAANPPVAGSCILKVRYQKDTTPGSENVDLTVKLYNDQTLVLTRTYTNIGAIVEDDYTLSGTEVTNCGNFDKCRVEMIANA